MNLRSPTATTASSIDHRANRLLAALKPDDFAVLAPHLQGMILQQDQVLYEVGDPLRHAYFPHDTIVSLVAVLKDGRTAEMAVYGREGALGLVGAMTIRQSLGRYIVQSAGTASRIELERVGLEDPDDIIADLEQALG
jgi:CRP-like cAMP-binding protein